MVIKVIIDKGVPIKKYCKRNGYNLKNIISIDTIDLKNFNKTLSCVGFLNSFDFDNSLEYLVEVCKASLFSAVTNKIFNPFVTHDGIIIKFS